MADSFRFLVNVDQCLNMSQYEMFFYKLESQQKFHSAEIQLSSGGFSASMRQAAADIRLYLNRHSYEVDDYQIIVTMRSNLEEQASSWDTTLLSRLIQLDAELQKARIYIIGAEEHERAVNLFMLYNANYTPELPKLDRYLSGERFVHDCKLLFGKMGLDWESDADEKKWEDALKKYRGTKSHDPALLAMLEAYYQRHKAAHGGAQGKKLVDLYGEEDEPVNAGFDKVNFPAFVKTKLSNYQVFEILTNRNDERKRTLDQLRLVEFINRSTDERITVGDDRDARSLSARCRDNWTEIENDTALEQRYADMLFCYETMLRHAQTGLNTDQIYTASQKKLPEKQLPGEEEICASFVREEDESGKEKKPELEMDRVLEQYVKSGIPDGMEAWQKTYDKLKLCLDNMESDLRAYAAELSRQYSAALRQRKIDTRVWEQDGYASDPDTKKKYTEAAQERENCLEDLKNSNGGATLSFTDQLNMENSLDQCSVEIGNLLRRVEEEKTANFFELLGVIFLMFLLHYFVMQPYFLRDIGLLPLALLYIAALLLLMLTCRTLPRTHFRRLIRKKIQELRKEMELFIGGYHKKASDFQKYINLLNRLDYLTRYVNLLGRTCGEAEVKEKALGWHRSQIKEHLRKLEFFHGLIGSHSARAGENAAQRTIDFLEETQDVVECQIYWPQG